MESTFAAAAAALTSEAKIAICAEDAAWRTELRSRLEEANLQVIATAAGIEELLDQPPEARPDYVMLAAKRPHRDLSEAISALRSELGRVSVILVSERAREGEARRAVEQGADAVVLVDDLDRALLPVLLAVQAGHVTVPRQTRHELGRAVLTTREKQILGLVVVGLTNAQIASKLYLAESTIKSHLSSAFAKLGVSSRYEAVGVILDPERGRGLGVLTMPPERITATGAVAPRVAPKVPS